jgi:NSS family neurotransmitter:Na+ symporter
MAAGASLSLRDFLSFPVIAGENGGGAFLLMYLFFLAVLGLPLIMSELMLGRLGRRNMVDTLDDLSTRYGASVYWRLVGFFALFAGFLLLSSYSVVSGWSMAYFFKTVVGTYSAATLDGTRVLFNRFQTNAEAMALWHTLFAVLMVGVAAQQRHRGLERIVTLLVPIMALLLVVGLGYALYSGGLDQSVRYILFPDWSKVDASMPLAALQRAFFTLSLGLGVMLIYGAYVDDDVPIGYAAGQIVLIDLLFSIFTGLAINALVFSSGIQPTLDHELAFRVLPMVFGAAAYGNIFGALFFLLLTIAGLTTAVALMEALVTCYRDRFRVTRLRAATQLGFLVWLLGLGTIFSYSLWHDEGFTLTLDLGSEAYRLVKEAGFHDVIVFVSSHLIQPLVALCIAVFAGWVLPRTVTYEALNLPRRQLYEAWNFVIRYITPVLVLIVLLSTLGVVAR